MLNVQAYLEFTGASTLPGHYVCPSDVIRRYDETEKHWYVKNWAVGTKLYVIMCTKDSGLYVVWVQQDPISTWLTCASRRDYNYTPCPRTDVMIGGEDKGKKNSKRRISPRRYDFLIRNRFSEQLRNRILNDSYFIKHVLLFIELFSDSFLTI